MQSTIFPTCLWGVCGVRVAFSICVFHRLFYGKSTSTNCANALSQCVSAVIASLFGSMYIIRQAKLDVKGANLKAEEMATVVKALEDQVKRKVSHELLVVFLRLPVDEEAAHLLVEWGQTETCWYSRLLEDWVISSNKSYGSSTKKSTPIFRWKINVIFY